MVLNLGLIFQFTVMWKHLKHIFLFGVLYVYHC